MKNELEIILESLYLIINKDKKSNELINQISKKVDNISYITKVIYGVLENKIYLDYMISKLSSTKIRKIHDKILIILEIGIYNLYFLEKKDYAIVNELVELTKSINKKSSAYVNAILRNFIRKQNEISKIKEKDDLKSLSIRYSTPLDIVNYVNDNYGYEYTKNFLKSINSVQDLAIRVNFTKTNKKEVIEKLSAKNFEIEEGLHTRASLIVKNPSGLVDTDEFKNGLFTIQSEASSKVVEILNPQKKSKILDICAAPGTKTSYLAEYTDNDSLIIANDISENKNHLIEENISRLDLQNIIITNFDASIKKEDYFDKFDYVLCDLPCSGLGVMGRKPEIRYNRNINDIISLSKLQRDILDNSIMYLKKGGKLVFSTCTLGKIENIDNFNYLKDKNMLKNIKIEEKEYIEFSNYHDKTDGFFISKFEKI